MLAIADSPASRAVVRPGAAVERPDVPVWALAAGIVLVLVFAGLVVQTYAGGSLLEPARGAGAGARAPSN